MNSPIKSVKGSSSITSGIIILCKPHTSTQDDPCKVCNFHRRTILQRNSFLYFRILNKIICQKGKIMNKMGKSSEMTHFKDESFLNSNSVDLLTKNPWQPEAYRRVMSLVHSPISYRLYENKTLNKLPTMYILIFNDFRHSAWPCRCNIIFVCYTTGTLLEKGIHFICS